MVMSSHCDCDVMTFGLSPPFHVWAILSYLTYIYPGRRTDSFIFADLAKFKFGLLLNLQTFHYDFIYEWKPCSPK